ncbi:MAG: THUMP domain-containing protein [Thaumarchaeota archaeon]|nr:THUMP domain-containing protein [Nitrososphaerota archaeon]
MNLIVTCARHFENETKDEIKTILDEIGDQNPEISLTEFSGILSVNTAINPIEVVKKIRQKLEDEPWAIRYTMRAIPISAITKTDIQEIRNAAQNQAKILGPNETYRITIEKRNSSIPSGEIISQIADTIPNKVSLEKYDWIILVEILGGITGVSVLRDEDVLSVEREKRGSLD